MYAHDAGRHSFLKRVTGLVRVTQVKRIAERAVVVGNIIRRGTSAPRAPATPSRSTGSDIPAFQDIGCIQAEDRR